MSLNVTMIRLRRDVVARLKQIGRKGESYTQIVEKLLDAVGDKFD